MGIQKHHTQGYIYKAFTEVLLQLNAWGLMILTYRPACTKYVQVKKNKREDSKQQIFRACNSVNVYCK